MLIQIKDSPSFNYTPDSEIVELFENGIPLSTITAIIASCDHITKTAARHRVCEAIRRSQLPGRPFAPCTVMPSCTPDPFKHKEV